MRSRIAALALAAVALAAALAPGLAGANPATQDGCPGTVTSPSIWKQLGNDVLENLLFSDGALWVSDSTASAVRKLLPNKTEPLGGGLSSIPSPGGLAKHPSNGTIYAGWGSSAANAAQRNGQARVVRFDPANPNGTLEVVATGLHMANGLAFGPGLTPSLYVSNDFDSGLVRILPSGGKSGVAGDQWGMNGLVLDPSGTSLLAAITFDQRSPIARIPLSGSPTSIFTQLSAGVASLQPQVHPSGADPSKPLLGVKGLDDMTRDAAGNLYVVANGTGELIKVATDGSACLIAGGLQNPSSVRIAPAGFTLAGAATTFFVTEFSGAIKIIGYTP